MKKSCGQRQLSTPRASETPRCQASKRLVIPYKVKEGSKARKQSKEGRRSKGKKQRHWDITEPLENPFTYLKEPITVRMAKQDVSHRSA
jgi:hypothetical protein